MSDQINILFLGDIVGKPGRFGVKQFLEHIETHITFKPDFVIANCENASHGFGLTEKNYNELIEYGINALTSGNHIWDRKDIYNYIGSANKLIRPLNYPTEVLGLGCRIFELENCSIAVMNLLGRVFMEPYDSPWEILKKEVLKIQAITPTIIIDFHAEATAEKIAFGHFASELGVSGVIGTHTHVQTADEKILNNTMAYITDVGYCGAANSVIGMEAASSIKKLSTLLPTRYEIPDVKVTEINGVNICLNPKTGIANDIQRLNIKLEIDLENL